MTNLTLHFDGGWLRISAYGYENSAAQSHSDANWIKCRLDFKLADLAGGADISISTTDILSFRSEVKTALESLSGSAVLTNDEGDIRIELNIGLRGNVKVTVNIVKIGIIRYEINFIAESDQTRVLQCLEGLTKIAEQYPEIHI